MTERTAPQPCTRLLVFAATDGSGRTRTIPWPDGEDVVGIITVGTTDFSLVADTRVEQEEAA